MKEREFYFHLLIYYGHLNNKLLNRAKSLIIMYLICIIITI